jgi:hypothetical protein
MWDESLINRKQYCGTHSFLGLVGAGVQAGPVYMYDKARVVFKALYSGNNLVLRMHANLKAEQYSMEVWQVCIIVLGLPRP